MVSDSVIIKSDDEVEQMRAACLVASDVLDYIGEFVAPGVSTGGLDKLCHEYMVAQNVIPAPLNYQPAGHSPYPKATCISVNNQVCHGVPRDDCVLKSGDIINIDITVIKDGWHGDTSRMYYVGKVERKAAHLCEVTLECLWRGIESVRAGAPLNAIGEAIEKHAKQNNFSVVREYCGHGIGRAFHEPPQVVHYKSPNEGGLVLKENMVFTIEPMINVGRADVKVQKDGWTVVTRDRSLSAQWEHTICVKKEGAQVLTHRQ